MSQLTEKKICTKSVYGAWKTKDTETNCDDGKLNFENLFTEPKHNHTRDINEKISCAPVVKTDVRQGFNDDLVKRKDSAEINGKSLQNEDHSEKKDKHSNVKMETEDDVDFFDSDEEYDETHGFRVDEADVIADFEFLTPTGSLGGRYSEGIDQLENLPVYRRSIQAFAKANNFEIYDVIPDGNCMFQALSDQFMINGRLGYRPESLRNAAIEHLRKHPHKDGHHIQSFLCKETWEEYLKRMSRTKEWGDHIVLQALVDAFNLHITIINVFEDDVRHTILQPEALTERKQLQVFLGHVGEFHYLSLRPYNWTELWPYKSMMYRTIACLHHISPSAKHEIVGGKIAEMKASKLLSKREFTDLIEFHKDNRCIDYDNSRTDLQQNNGQELYFETYSLNEKELQNTEEASEYSVLDPLHIDVLTGIPLPHLSFILKLIFPQTMIIPNFPHCGPLVFENSIAYSVGTKRVGVDIHLKDISKSRKKGKYYSSSRSSGFVAAIIGRHKIVQHQHHHQEGPNTVPQLLADNSETHAGYCRVRVLLNDADIDDQNYVVRGTVKYLKEIKVSERVFMPPVATMIYEGLKCDTFPPEAQEWIDRRRKFSFPSSSLFHAISESGCTLIKKAHENSRDPDIEWKYDFSLAAQTIFTTGLSQDQKYGFWVFKILIDNVSCHLQKKLKNKHLIAVYYRALEDIPYELWETNFSGCILFVLRLMVSCLKAGYLPHYFIPSVNLIACLSAQEINALCVNVECIRMFPLFVLQITAENHGYTFAKKLIKMVFRDCRSFQHNKDLMTLFTDAFMPGTLGVMRVFTRLGFYETAFKQLMGLYEQMLLVKIPAGCSGSFEFLDVFEIAIKSFRQKSTRVILTLLFKKYLNTDVLSQVIDESSTFAKDILPWKLHFEIEWMEIPFEKVSDFSTLAEYFHACGVKEYKKRNKTLATATLETAITCLQRCIEMGTICPSTKEDMHVGIKKEVNAQNDEILFKFRRQLMSYYINIWNVSMLDWNVIPLIRHISDIEKLCLELPEMTDILIGMFRYVRMSDKALEYEKKSKMRKNIETKPLLPRPMKR